jgi:hypothetical protein
LMRSESSESNDLGLQVEYCTGDQGTAQEHLRDISDPNHN